MNSHLETPPSSPHSPFDDDGHMEYLFLEKRHWEQSTIKKHTHRNWMTFFATLFYGKNIGTKNSWGWTNRLFPCWHDKTQTIQWARGHKYVHARSIVGSPQTKQLKVLFSRLVDTTRRSSLLRNSTRWPRLYTAVMCRIIVFNLE